MLHRSHIKARSFCAPMLNDFEGKLNEIKLLLILVLGYEFIALHLLQFATSVVKTRD
jgi:hypothetical protein